MSTKTLLEKYGFESPEEAIQLNEDFSMGIFKALLGLIHSKSDVEEIARQIKDTSIKKPGDLEYFKRVTRPLAKEPYYHDVLFKLQGLMKKG